nr:hypothetical protein [Tanacetum cinerariifolium]
MSQAQSMLMMRLLLRINCMLRMLHPLLSHLTRISIPAPVPVPAWSDSEKRLGIALGPGYEVGESLSTAVARPAGGLRADYGFVATMIERSCVI